jgi:hypothetical protein
MRAEGVKTSLSFLGISHMISKSERQEADPINRVTVAEVFNGRAEHMSGFLVTWLEDVEGRCAALFGPFWEGFTLLLGAVETR